MSDFLVTYLLHSTVILALTLTLLQLPAFQTASIRDAALRIALIAGLLTSAFTPLHRQAVPLPAPVLAQVEVARDFYAPSAAGPDTAAAGHDQDITVAQATPLRPSVDWAAVLLLASTVFAVSRFNAAWFIIRRGHIGRASDPDLQARLHRLASNSSRRRIEVCWTRLRVPCALGLHHILLPHDVRDRLSADELAAVLAHEYAHLLRRDPLWNLGLSFLTQLLWFQPLNWIALRAWRDASEEICDEWAARRAPRLSLAQAILTLARQGQHAAPTLLTSQVAHSTHLSKRIQALIEPKETRVKRTHLLVMAVVPSLLGTITPPLALASTATKSHLTVVLDAGHGGRNLGAVGLNGVVREDAVVLAIAKKVQVQLEKQGVTVILTRADASELSLQERVKRIPRSANAFISLHTNASKNQADHGVQTFITRQEAGAPLLAESRKLAESVHAAVVVSTGARNGGVIFEDRYNFYVLRKANVPSALIEVGYMTNEREARMLGDGKYQDRIAEGIARGVLLQR